MTEPRHDPETPPRTDLDTQMPNDGYGIVPNATDEELRDGVHDAEAEAGLPEG
ncbi:MAG TPA: hypothetical protein VKA85_05465 [Candidatus Limnocylindrales bacterium]|nr:hypothetical protein [Candidatus Limnocylindrales bacterium]